jgi:hypothetical protein
MLTIIPYIDEMCWGVYDWMYVRLRACRNRKRRDRRSAVFELGGRGDEMVVEGR